MTSMYHKHVSIVLDICIFDSKSSDSRAIADDSNPASSVQANTAELVEQMSHDMKAASGSVDPALNPECGPSP